MEKQMKTNGCGPEWVPSFLKVKLFNWFFEASCDKHDEGYIEGGNELRRWACDYKFFQAMLRDVKRLKIVHRPAAYVVASTFYLLVVAGGWTSFNYW